MLPGNLTRHCPQIIDNPLDFVKKIQIAICAKKARVLYEIILMPLQELSH
ncbi:hypothetical protein SEEV1955_21993 [Salmonella enterica subsp. enterica serovar Virchow str. ATCC 51955]|nr:hypothetical protein SEEV1955_21993 [Salmonella enterica subsp. enterica serovar Virchow str. ATCC 51955]